MKLRKFIASRSKRYAYIAKWSSFRRQPWICWTEEISIAEAKRRFGYIAPDGAIGVRTGYSVHQPLEVSIAV